MIPPTPTAPGRSPIDAALSRVPADATPMDHQRARALVVLSWILIPAGLCFAVLYHLILGTHFIGLAGDFLTASIAVSYLIVTLAGRVRVAAHVVALGTWIALVWGMALSGGITSPYLPFTVLMMVWIGVLHTGRGTLLWAVASVLTVAGFAWLDRAGVELPDRLALGGAHAFTLVAVPVGIAVVVGLTGLARSMERRARQQTEQLNEELRQALDQARRAAEVRQLFLATMSHELRTPLNAVFASMDMMELKGSLSPEAQQYLDRMQSAGNTLLSVINDTIDWSRLESGGLSLELRDAEVRPLCLGVRDVLIDTADRRRLSLTVEIDPDVPDTLHTDGSRLRQILLNLLTNGLAYTREGGVGLRVSATPDGGVQFDVHDTGPGIAQAHLDQLFDPFSRLDDSRWDRPRGSGLGLAICKRFAESLGGTISVTSAQGTGSVFSVRLPGRGPA